MEQMLKRIQEIMDQQNKTAEDIGKVLNVPAERVERWLQGVYFASFHQLETVAQYLNVPVEDFFN